MAKVEEEKKEVEFEERVIHIDRVMKATKGGRAQNFRVIVAAGDHNGRVGCALGKAREIPVAVRKATEAAKKEMIEVPLKGTTIIHEVIGEYSASRVFLSPALPGTGVIAGGPARAILEVVGIQDILTKSLNSNNAMNVAQAVMDALRKLCETKEVADLRRGKGADRGAESTKRS